MPDALLPLPEHRSAQNSPDRGNAVQKARILADAIFLTTDEVSQRYRGQVSVGTLENWRAQKIGPSFIKIGKAVLYPIEELEAWDSRNRVQCDDAPVIGRRRHRVQDAPDGTP